MNVRGTLDESRLLNNSVNDEGRAHHKLNNSRNRPSTFRCTVGIPTRNRPEKIRLCLDALSNGHLRDVQVVVADSSQDKRTEEVCELYSAKLAIEYIKHDRMGGSPARNIIANFCENPVVVYIDDDVYVDKNCLIMLLNCYEDLKNDSRYLIAGAVKFLSPKSWSPLQLGKLTVDGVCYPVLDSSEADFVNSALVLVPKAVYKKIEWNDSLLRGDDVFYSLRCQRNGIKFFHCRDALALHDQEKNRPLTYWTNITADYHYIMLYKYIVVEHRFFSLVWLEVYGFIRRMLRYLTLQFDYGRSKIIDQSHITRIPAASLALAWVKGLLKFLRDLSNLLGDANKRTHLRTRCLHRKMGREESFQETRWL
jgi:glycosyltransferase involved in cell wall biosynthesis